MKVAEESLIGGSSSRPIHVYLSFKGDEETCRFTDLLWAALESNDLNTFWDDKNLEDTGHSILLPRHFLKPIRQSNISIIVFSKNYASSIWCLEELSEIAARIHDRRFTVFPVFYDVNPSEVQNQSHSFETAFAEHELRFTANMRKVRSWRLAMKQAANLSGWHVPSEPDPQVIDEIIKEVKRRMRELEYVDADLVGMQSRVREVEKLLGLGSNDEIRVVGIYGMGGIGKSTLARVVYDKISHRFDASHFVLDESEFDMSTGIVIGKNILIVLDGVDIFNMLVRLLIGAIRKSQLGGGSRFIITTRDEGVLKLFDEHHIYRVKLLTNDEALQLLCRKAFKSDFPIRGYEKQIESVLQYANGLPLAIVVLSQFLYNRKSSEWALVEFKKVANSVIMKILKKSFDDLMYPSYQKTFLDIACFFTGKEIEVVEGILDSTNRDNSAKYNVQKLIEKSLMAIIDQKIQMHGLLQEMGREIVRQEFPNSRLWDFHDIYRVMQNDTASLKVEAIVLELEECQERTLKVEGLSLMRNLRLLIFQNVKFSGVLKYLPLQLRYILWHRYPFACLPASFVPHNLIELLLPDSSITNIWEGDGEIPDSCITSRVERAQSQFIISRRERDQQTPNSCMTNIWEGDMTFPLRNMNLSGSKNLIKMSNFKIFSDLERLDLEGCIKLSRFDASIASLSKLKFLNLRNCINLATIPNNLFSLPSLEVLNLACCSKFAYCLKFCPLEELSETEIIEQSFYRKRQKLCRQNSI